jgi:ribulose-5-phosphate 4-epimerase/fuculose-1-phosphate aldolase
VNTVRDVIDLMIDRCRSLFDRGYTCSTGGNVSHRFNGGILMEATNTSFGRLKPDDFAT